MAVLIVGVSTRAAAESAAKAGFEVTSIDAFSDLDQHASVQVRSVEDGFSAAKAVHAALDVECDAVVYLASFENHPDAVGDLALGRSLWGNTPEVLGQVRDPQRLRRAFLESGHTAPRVRMTANNGSEGCHWMLKPLAQGGGHGVRPWQTGEGVPRDCYLQERVDGAPGSVVFVAAEGRAVTLGVSRQLIGEDAFGASGYRYCGSILTLEAPGRGEHLALVHAASSLADSVAGAFGLVGVNGIDFVVDTSGPQPVEVNPRWCASMELVERASGVSVFEMHAAACTTGALPQIDLMRNPGQNPRGAVGKAVIFARQDSVVGDTRIWLEAVDQNSRASIRDIPHPGTRIRTGRPICTVFATGSDDAHCHRELEVSAERIYAEIAHWGED